MAKSVVYYKTQAFTCKIIVAFFTGKKKNKFFIKKEIPHEGYIERGH